MHTSLYTLKTFSDDNIMNSYSSINDKHISQVVGFPYSILAEVNQMGFFKRVYVVDVYAKFICLFVKCSVF